ncbi:MAG: Rho termination factor N-terminal domain-containing protein [bacterium]|nr:Rho termination factor N-terminal domain-containing protein [bacterium]
MKFIDKEEDTKEKIKEVKAKVNKKENDVNLADKTLTELKAMAKENNIKGYSTMKKQELIDALK